MVPIPLASAPEIAERSALTRILAEAEMLFAQRGFDGVSINEVALAAGVCKANVFHHFATKQDLYERVLAQACDAFGRSLNALELKEQDLATRLRRLVEWHNAFLYQRPHGTRLILRELTGSPTVLERNPVFELVRRNFDRVVALLAEVSDQMREGISPALVAKVVLSLNLFGFQTERLNEKLAVAGSLATRPELQQQLLDLLLHGIEAPNHPP
ncbi:TetR/AcrR family transcriptional regulator [Tahibacter harae]|uniref:TetR/AcrR family transcriptional regulator n=1 Tax=Tahibacter harae TaxID=2963937 RepID=A0ABT1QUJ6_9GAMM|nr:TetR/AcrR family transcriptional regulator [Tahibacter harae]